MNSKPPQETNQSVSPMGWMRILVLLGGVGMYSGGGAALANETDSVSLQTLIQAEESYKTTANYLQPNQASTHSPAPSAQVGLNLPNSPSPSPTFSSSGSSSEPQSTSSSPAEAAMLPSIPVPPPAAIVADAPASAPSMADRVQPATGATPSAQGSPSLAVPTARDVANEAATGNEATAAVGSAQAPADRLAPSKLGGAFIDPTHYNVGATQAPQATPNVVFAERSSGCQISVAGGQTTPTATCETATAQANEPASRNAGGIQVGPVNVSTRGVRLGNTTVISREFLNEKLRPLNVLRRGTEEYVFPLSVPASITSLFGWRMHPIHQSWRFHAGTDLAAPEGTPVLATRAGRVAVSDNLGGYGLTVILRHDDDNLESRYAHLSRIAVRSGEWVEQGEVVGLVGNTGTSTGPHLHFEMRQLTSQGWVAVDAQEVLEYGIANLLEIINNPLMALNAGEAKGVDAVRPADYPYRPAQPNAS